MPTTGFTHESTYNESKEWYTPPEIFEALNCEFDLDPCAPAGGLPWIPAKRVISLPDNGLILPWDGLVWMNPPYGSDTPEWMRRFVQHRNGLALVFSRTDTAWFHDTATQADALLFMRGRVRFMKPDGTRGGTPGAGSLLIACGEEATSVLKHAAYTSELGWYVEL